MSQIAPFGLMILYALVLLLVAKPLDNWRESRIKKKIKSLNQGELFASKEKELDKGRPLVASHR